MFTLVTDRSKYFRVKRGQSAEELESELKTPVSGAVFAGRIIEVAPGNFQRYAAQVGDTYGTIALKFGAGFKPVYPTCKLFVPCKNPRGI